MTTAREHVTNALVILGYDENAAECAVPAFHQWLLWRAEQLRAEGRHADATWFVRVANEVVAG